MSSIFAEVIQPESTQSKTQVNQRAIGLPASWYVAMHSKDLGKKPKAIQLFGQTLVAWRDQNNHPVIMERYCSHLGASLAMGQVVDGCIQCPYHHWRYDSGGKCIFILDVERIPPMARQATYVTVERYGYIWVWFGSQNPLFSLPEFSPLGDEKHNYLSLRFVHKIKTTVQRLLENSCDYYHVVPVHGQKVSGSIQYTLLDNQHTIQQSQPLIQKEAWFGVLVEYPLQKYVGLLGLISQALGLSTQVFATLIDCWPSGCMITSLMDTKERFKLLVCTTPVAENATIAHFLFAMKKTGNFLLDRLILFLVGWQFKIVSGTEDVPILTNLKSDGGGAYVKQDRGILKFREFYQRWVDKVE